MAEQIQTSDADLQHVLAAANEEMSAIATGDAERYFAILAEDAVFMPPNSMPKAGEELRQWLRDFLNDISIEYLQSVDGETEVAADFAYHEYACSWRATPKSGGDPTLLHFKGIHIIRRVADGSWKLARNIWNLSPAPAVAM